MPKNKRHATEEFPKTTRFWEISSCLPDTKTDPTPLLASEDSFSNCIPETALDNWIEPELLQISKDVSTSIHHLRAITGAIEGEDLESDTSSGSGQSASCASTPASRNIAWGGDSVTWDGNVSSEDCSHMPYASHMRMSKFRREQNRFNWETLSQAIVSKLYPHWPQAQCRQQIDLLYYLRHIGRGGSSSVYAAAFEGFGLDDTLAVKILEDCRRKTITGLPSEFQIMQGLKHNHIVAFVTSFAQEDKFGVLMYPLAPYNLAQYLQEVSEYNSEYGKLNQSRVKTLLTALGCLSSALLYLHVTQNIKHKDIKPENILVDRHGSVLLADFGISKQYQGDTVTCGPTAFTEKYAAPEVAAQGSRDLSADIFSLGCVFLEMATVILGENLKSLHTEIFDNAEGDSCSKQAYCHSLPKVRRWMCHLKGISPRGESTWEDHSSPNPEGGRASDYKRTTGKHSLQEQHLDVILIMMSENPDKRPSIRDLYQLFKEFAAHCSECHDKDSCPESDKNSTSYAQVLQTTSSTGINSISNGQQPNIPHSHASTSSIQFKEGVGKCHTESTKGTKKTTNGHHICESPYHSAQQIAGQSDMSEAFTRGAVSHPISSLILAAPKQQYSQTSVVSRKYAAAECDRLSTAKASGNLQPVVDENEEDEDSSETETYYSDAEISGDEDLVVDSGPDNLAARVKSLVFNHLERLFSEGWFNCCGSGEPTKSRREGFVSSGPPSKRRSVGQGKSVPSPHDDGPDDDDDEPDERRGQNIGEGSNAPLQSRKWFACQFFQRDSNRCISRSCSGPGWPALYRLKEHLMRTHRIYPCDRCQEVFRKSDDLKIHRRQVVPCELRDKVPDEHYDWGQGFDEEQASKLKTRIRKRQLTEATDEQKWGEWYKILFPRDSEVPLPYYDDKANSLLSDLAEHLSMDIRPLFSEDNWPLVETRIQESIQEFTLRRLQPPDESPAQYLDSSRDQTSSFAQQSTAQSSTIPTRMPQNALHGSTRGQGRLFTPSEHVIDLSFGNGIFHPQRPNRLQQSDRGNETNDSAYYTSFNSTNVSSHTSTGFSGHEPVAMGECVRPEATLLSLGQAFHFPDDIFGLPGDYLTNPSDAQEQPDGLELNLDVVESSQHNQNRYLGK